MAKLLLNLRNVPDDEADDVRAMLDAHRIGFYETPPSGWGLFAGGIFVERNADIAEAKRLMADYQAQPAPASAPNMPRPSATAPRRRSARCCASSRCAWC